MKKEVLNCRSCNGKGEVMIVDGFIPSVQLCEECGGIGEKEYEVEEDFNDYTRQIINNKTNPGIY